jgi:hypothetical protein
MCRYIRMTPYIDDNTNDFMMVRNQVPIRVHGVNPEEMGSGRSQGAMRRSTTRVCSMLTQTILPPESARYILVDCKNDGQSWVTQVNYEDEQELLRKDIVIEDCTGKEREPGVWITNNSFVPWKINKDMVRVDVVRGDLEIKDDLGRLDIGVVLAECGGVRNDKDEIICYGDELNDPPRPRYFPFELWKYVSPKYRTQAVKVFQKYSTERLLEAIKAIEGIRIGDKDTENGRRTLAQVYYNLDAYFHVDAEDPPLADSEPFTIETERPIYARAKVKRFTDIQKAFLQAKTNRLLRQGKIRNSMSSTNLHMVLVEFPERIKKFFDKHGENAHKDMLDLVYESEVSTFYRLTVDMRPVNEATIADVYPLPKIIDLLDSAKGSRIFSLSDVEDAFFTIALAR